jgi:hypothetical protein
MPVDTISILDIRSYLSILYICFLNFMDPGIHWPCSYSSLNGCIAHGGAHERKEFSNGIKDTFNKI